MRKVGEEPLLTDQLAESLRIAAMCEYINGNAAFLMEMQYLKDECDVLWPGYNLCEYSEQPTKLQIHQIKVFFIT